jgi:hypothetical protein
MAEIPDMHDGFFDGLWISEDQNAYLFLRTEAGERATLVLKNVERIHVANFKTGNIIFNLSFLELTIECIQQLYGFRDLGKAQEFFKKTQERELRVLEIVPSYGATCTALFRTTEILAGHVLPLPVILPPSC